MPATLLTCVFLLAATPDDTLAPWASNHHPTDVPKQQIEEITAGRAEYPIVKHGTMDGRNCRSPQGVWQPFRQTWESNRSVRMENVGDTDVVNPWLSNGSNDFRSLPEIVAQGRHTEDVRRARKPGPCGGRKSNIVTTSMATTTSSTIRSRSSTSTDTTPAATIRSAWRDSGTRLASGSHRPASWVTA